MSRETASPVLCYRRENGVFCVSRPLDTPRGVAIMPGPLDKAECRNVPEPRPGAPSDANGYDLRSEQTEASGASRRLFYAPAAAQVFENSAVRSRRDLTPPRRLLRCRLEAVPALPVRPSGREALNTRHVPEASLAMPIRGR